MTTRKLAGVAVALLALLLVAAPMVFAQTGTVTSTMTNTLQTGAIPITVKDQPVVNGAVTIDSATSNGPGWMTIHADANGQAGAVIGYTAVKSGVNSNIVVKIDVAKATPVLWAMLHVDKGTVGTYEFPGADIPATVNGQIEMVKFNVTGGLAATTVVTGTATTTATATLVPTVAATVTLTPTVAATATLTPTAAVTNTTAPSASGTPTKLPTTGGSPVPWSLVVLGLGGLIMVGGLGLALARRS